MKNYLILYAGLTALLFTSCLTVYAKKMVPPPYVPKEEAYTDAGKQEKRFIVYYSPESKPVIDGTFSEWEGLESVHSRHMIYGGSFNPENTDGLFILRADNEYLYIYADITDDEPQENAFPAPQAWRDDSIEIFLGTDTSRHSTYKSTDHRIRIVPQNKKNRFAFDLSIDDVSVKESVKAAVVYSARGYKIEAAVPFSLLGLQRFRVGQPLRGDFQINDADKGKERSRLTLWNGLKDNPYADPSGWGNGIVSALPASKK